MPLIHQFRVGVGIGVELGGIPVADPGEVVLGQGEGSFGGDPKAAQLAGPNAGLAKVVVVDELGRLDETDDLKLGFSKAGAILQGDRFAQVVGALEGVI